MAEGVILLGHGSRRQEANEEIRQIGCMIADENPEILYETAFLSLCHPDLSEAVIKLKMQRVDKIIVAPIFLATGNHIAIDIPEEIAKLKVEYPDIKFIIAGHIGPDPAIAEIIKERIRTAQA